jgi:hypothetical protein
MQHLFTILRVYRDLLIGQGLLFAWQCWRCGVWTRNRG